MYLAQGHNTATPGRPPSVVVQYDLCQTGLKRRGSYVHVSNTSDVL